MITTLLIFYVLIGSLYFNNYGFMFLYFLCTMLIQYEILFQLFQFGLVCQLSIFEAVYVVNWFSFSSNYNKEFFLIHQCMMSKVTAFQVLDMRCFRLLCFSQFQLRNTFYFDWFSFVCDLCSNLVAFTILGHAYLVF